MLRALLALCGISWGVFFSAQIAFAVEIDVYLNEIFYDAIGSDTGQEFIEIFNSSDQPVDITGWDIDPSSAPYFTLPQFILNSHSYLTIYINAEGTSTSETIYTGANANMSNTKGPVALFSSTEHPEANLVDYISYGAGGQTNESKAIAKGIWSADTFITNIEEGQSIALIEGSWVAGTPTPGQFNISYTEPHDEELPDENPQDKTQDENLPEISEQTTTRVKPTTPTTGGSNTTMNDLRLLINEFVSDPDDGDDEWIELYNPNGRSVMLTDWSIIEGGGRETIFSTTIPANGFHSIERPKGRLNNTGDTILLQNDNFDIVDSVTYGSWDDGNINDNAPNASNPDSVARRTDGLDSDLDIDDFIRTAPTKNAPNKTLSIKTPLLEKIIPENKKIEIEKENRSPVAQFTSPDIALNNNSIIFDASDSGDLDNDSLTYIWNFGNNDGMSGRIADYHYPHAGDYTVSLMVSDGKLTSVSEKIITVVDDPKLLPLIVDDIILQKLIRISEVLPNPTGNDADGEWVEIQNLSNQTIDLSSWELDDKEGGSKPYTLPEWALIEPQSFLLIEREESRLAFNNTVDEVRLFSPDKKLVDEISYASVKEGWSYAISNNEWDWNDTPTPGTINQKIFTNNYEVASNTPLETNNSPVPHGTELTIEGVVTASPFLFAKTYFYVHILPIEGIDLPGGIQVYMQKAEWPEIPIGTIVALTGTLSTSASEPRLHIHSADSVYPQKKSETLFPRDISIDELTDNEVGSLITVDGEVIEKSGQNVYLTNDAEELRIFIAKNTDIDTSQIVEGSFISITGILSKTKTGWRLLPRSSEDIQTILVKGETEDSLTTSTTSEKQSLVYYLVATLITLLTGLLLVIYRLRTRERVSIAKTE